MTTNALMELADRLDKKVCDLWLTGNNYREGTDGWKTYDELMKLLKEAATQLRTAASGVEHDRARATSRRIGATEILLKMGWKWDGCVWFAPKPITDQTFCHCPEHGSWVAAESVNRLVRQIDVAINGEAGAAKQASLCDVTAQIISMHRSPTGAEARDAWLPGKMSIANELRYGVDYIDGWNSYRDHAIAALRARDD